MELFSQAQISSKMFQIVPKVPWALAGFFVRPFSPPNPAVSCHCPVSPSFLYPFQIQHLASRNQDPEGRTPDSAPRRRPPDLCYLM